MDPMNNPTPTPTPEPGAVPVPKPPVAPVPEPGGAPVTPEPPVAPVTPEPPVAPASEPPVAPVDVAAPASEPVNPVVNPEVVGAPVNPVFQPGGPDGLSATDPIMQPEAPKAPDPVEEELKAPMKAAGPVPGSIGSAVSGPQSEGEAVPPSDNPFASSSPKTPSVSFNDPAAEAQGGAPTAKKPVNKTTLIALCVVAGMIVIALVAILVMQLMSSQPSGGSSGGTGNTTVVIEEEEKEEEEPEEEETASTISATSGTMTCTKTATGAEDSTAEEAVSGTTTVTVEFADGALSTISLTKTVEGVETPEQHQAVASELTLETAPTFSLTATDGELNLSIDAVKANYEALDFVCEVL